MWEKCCFSNPVLNTFSVTVTSVAPKVYWLQQALLCISSKWSRVKALLSQASSYIERLKSHIPFAIFFLACSSLNSLLQNRPLRIIYTPLGQMENSLRWGKTGLENLLCIVEDGRPPRRHHLFGGGSMACKVITDPHWEESFSCGI